MEGGGSSGSTSRMNTLLSFWATLPPFSCLSITKKEKQREIEKWQRERDKKRERVCVCMCIGEGVYGEMWWAYIGTQYHNLRFV